MVAATVVQRWGSVEGVVAWSRSLTSLARSFHFSRHAEVALLGAGVPLSSLDEPHPASTRSSPRSGATGTARPARARRGCMEFTVAGHGGGDRRTGPSHLS